MGGESGGAVESVDVVAMVVEQGEYFAAGGLLVLQRAVGEFDEQDGVVAFETGLGAAQGGEFCSFDVHLYYVDPGELVRFDKIVEAVGWNSLAMIEGCIFESESA